MRACVVADAHDCGAFPALPGEVDVLAVGPGRVHWTQVERGHGACRVQRSSEPPRDHPSPSSSLRGPRVWDGCAPSPGSWDVKTRGAEPGTLPAVADM